MRRLCTAARTLFATLLLLLALPSLALATEGDLQLVSITGDMVTGNASSGYTIYIRDGDTVTVDLNVKNATGSEIDYIKVTQEPTYGEGDDAWNPIEFPHPKTNSIYPPVANTEYDGYRWYTSDTSGDAYTYSEYKGFDIAAGVTATFTINIGSGDLAAGTYNWNLQLGRIRYDFERRIVVIDPTLSYWDTFDMGSEVEETFVTIPIRVVVYNQVNASIQAGVNTGTGYDPQLDASPIDFGTINLANADESALSATRDIWVLNNRTAHASDRVANTTDAHGNPVTVTVGFGLETFTNGHGGSDLYSPFSLGGSDTTFAGLSWDPLPPRTGNSFSYANSGVTFDATYFIAGTYTGNFLVYTTPHKLLVNGQMSDGTGVYRIPVSVTLTGTNPRLLPRVTDLTATPNNGYVELTWTPADGASDYTEYTIYRRVGTETNGNPDTWSWEGYEVIGTKMVGDNDELLYVDANVENGTTYSYTVICGEPYRGYAAAAATATPDASIQSRMLAPYSSVSNSQNCVELEWHMNDLYGGYQSDGAGMVDHFNVYRDGVLVDVIYQSAVYDEVRLGWHDDGTGTGTQIYGPTSHYYSWTVEEPVPELYVPYQWTVSAVSPSGVESYLDEEGPGYAYGDLQVITGHDAYFEDDLYDYNKDYFDEQEIYDGPAMMVRLDFQSGALRSEELRVWRSEGTTPPDTSQPVCSTIGFNGASFADRGVIAGRTYTYTAQPVFYSGTTGEIIPGDYYTFTVKAVTPSSSDYYHFSTPTVTWRIVNGTTASLEFNAPKNITATVYRNGTKLSYTPDEGYDTWYFDIEDDPGADGTYVYRVEYTYSGITTSREFTFVRNTQPVDTSSLLKPPDAPTLAARTAGDSNVILSWTPASTGGTPEGYHIYRTDGNRQIANGRYLTGHRWNGDYEYYEQWGNARYITLSGGDTLTFVDGYVEGTSSGYYMGDSHKGEITGLSWDDSNLPHTYYITAYNRAGESAPSGLIVFSENADNPSGYPIAPPNPVDELPAAPTIERVWVELSDSSSYRYGFASWLSGDVRVAWSDSDAGGDIDSWTVTFAGTYLDQYNPPQTESLSYQLALVNPQTKQGISENAPKCGLRILMGDSGDIGRTITVNVAAENSLGSATSESRSVLVLDAPRFYALPDNGGALLKWTDLSRDTSTQITGWEIWRKPAYGTWECVDTLPGSLAYAGTEKGYGNVDVSYYQWRDSEVENGWTYEYKVVAKCSDGHDRPSVVREVTPSSTAAVEAPGAPRNLTAQVVNGVVFLSWDEPATGGAVSYYCPQVNGDNIDWNNYAISNVSGSSTSTTWAPNTPGTYQLTVWAYAYADGVELPDPPGSWEIDGYDSMTDDEKLEALYPNHSNVVEVTITQADIDSQVTGYPGKPQPTATPGEGQVTLTWPACEDTTYYTIDRENNYYPDIPDVMIAAVPGQTTYTWTDTNAEPGVRYRYVVSARNSGGRGIYTDVYATAYGMTFDQRAAARVEALIEALPAPDDVTIDDAEQIMAVQEVWETLTAKQQALVDAALAQKLADDVAAVEELALLERYAELVAPVQAMIDALPDFDDVTEGDRAAVEAARAAYDALSPAEAKRLVKTARLVDAEEALATLADRAAAAAVAAQIEALPGVDTLALADATAVEAARAAYDALGASAKEYVPASLVSKLEADEARIAELVQQAADAEAAAPVIAALEALPPAANLTLADEGAVTAARTAYDALTASQKALVAEALVSNLEACEAKIPELRKAAEDEAAAAPVIAAIEALPEPDALSLEDAGAVSAARAGYDALSAAQQALVGDGLVGKLAACEARVAELLEELAQQEAEAAAAVVDGLIDAIGDPVTLDDAAAIATARAAYEALSDEAKALVTGLPELEAAEGALAALRDAAAAAAVDEAIAGLPAPSDVTQADEAAIVAAREAYEALSDEAKALVTGLPDLEAAEAALAALRPIPMYRLYNRWSYEHFYTGDEAERDKLVSVGWTYEGIGWYAPAAGDPVYRLYNRWAPGGDHHYTMDRSEYDHLCSVGWSGEGVGWYSDPDRAVPVYREYNPYEYAHNHNYTANRAEHDNLVSVGWKNEGIGWYGV